MAPDKKECGGRENGEGNGGAGPFSTKSGGEFGGGKEDGEKIEWMGGRRERSRSGGLGDRRNGRGVGRKKEGGEENWWLGVAPYTK